MKELFGFPLGWFVGYLIGSFVFASMDISLWTFDGRFVVVLASTFWGAALSYRIHSEYLNG